MPKPKTIEVRTVITLTSPVTLADTTAAIEAATSAYRQLGEVSVEVKMPRAAFGA